jgi:hypothetical protein
MKREAIGGWHVGQRLLAFASATTSDPEKISIRSMRLAIFLPFAGSAVGWVERKRNPSEGGDNGDGFRAGALNPSYELRQ